MPGGDQNLSVLEQSVGDTGSDQNPMLGRDDQIPARAACAKGARADQDGPQIWPLP
jgi:hypothetical protein